MVDRIGSNTSTDEILRRIAEDAEQTPQKHYSALGATFEDKKASFETDKKNINAGEKLGELGVAKAVGAKATEALNKAADLAAASAARSAGALRLATASNVILGVLGMAYEMMNEGFVRPHAQGDSLASHAANDAMMVGLSQSLDAPPAFKAAMARMRVQVATQGGAAVTAQLAGKDHGDLIILQLRADDGLSQGKSWAEAMAASKTPAEQKATMESFRSSSAGQRAEQDAAFGIGVAQALWAVGAKKRGEITPTEYEALFAKANANVDAHMRPPVLTLR